MIKISPDQLDLRLNYLRPAHAKNLEQMGCRAIAAECGYFALFQKEIAGHVNVPVFMSSLLQIRMAQQLVGPEKVVGILVAEKEFISDEVGKAARQIVTSHKSDEQIFQVITSDSDNSVFCPYLEYEIKKMAEDEISKTGLHLVHVGAEIT